MTISRRFVLVLWGQGFDEIAASIFVAGLRRLGQRVKLTAFNYQQMAGQHGLTLMPDLPLDQALRAAPQIRCLIVPASLAALQQFSYDPRLAELLGLVTEKQFMLVANSPPTLHTDIQTGIQIAQQFQLEPAHIFTYPPTEELLTFIHTELAPCLREG